MPPDGLPPEHPGTGESLLIFDLKYDDVMEALEVMGGDLQNSKKMYRRIRFLYWLANQVLGELQDAGIDMELSNYNNSNNKERQ